jgi:hypothetical protein
MSETDANDSFAPLTTKDQPQINFQYYIECQSQLMQDLIDLQASVEATQHSLHQLKFQQLTPRYDSGSRQQRPPLPQTPRELTHQQETQESDSELTAYQRLQKEREMQKTGAQKNSEMDFVHIGNYNWNLVLHMLFGIRCSVNLALDENFYDLAEKDFADKRMYQSTSEEY